MGCFRIFIFLVLPLLAHSEGNLEKANDLFYKNKFDEACQIYLENFDDPESLFYAAICFERLSKKEETRNLRKRISQELAPNRFAEEALFLTLLDQKPSQIDLLQSKYPQSPYLAYFWTLKVEDYLKENLFPQARELSEKIILHLAETEQPYFMDLKHKAYLSCAKSEFLSLQNGDKNLHIEYGLADLRRLLRETTSSMIEQERDYLFALFYLEKDEKRGLKWIDRTLNKYVVDNIEKSPYLFKLLKLKSEISWKKGELELTNTNIEQAEKAYIPKYVADDDYLDLLLLKAKVALKQQNRDAALNHLAAIINSPIVSIKRLEALYFRQEIFTSMGRSDLAARHHDTMQHLRQKWEKTYGKLDHNPQ